MVFQEKAYRDVRNTRFYSLVFIPMYSTILGKDKGELWHILESLLIPLRYCRSTILSDYDNVTVINDDILKVDITSIVNEYNSGKPIKVVANLPYYITTPIVMGLLECLRSSEQALI